MSLSTLAMPIIPRTASARDYASLQASANSAEAPATQRALLQLLHRSCVENHEAIERFIPRSKSLLPRRQIWWNTSGVTGIASMGNPIRRPRGLGSNDRDRRFLNDCSERIGHTVKFKFRVAPGTIRLTLRNFCEAPSSRLRH